jgi:DNA-binding IclR family transcriptional regulator
MEREAAASDPGEHKEQATVSTIDRAARLLRAVASFGPEGAALSDVARRTELGKATVHRLLSALVAVGFAYQDTATRRYRLGAGLGALAHAAHNHEVAALAQPILAQIARETGDTVYASVREGMAAICVARELGSFPIRTLSLDAGHRRPLGIGSGSLALLAFLEDREIELVLARNRRWLEDFPQFGLDEIRRLVAETRRYGFSFIDGRIVPGMNAIGVPVLDRKGRPLAALSLAAIADRVRGERISQLARILQAGAADLAASLAPASDDDRPDAAARPTRARAVLPAPAAARATRKA